MAECQEQAKSIEKSDTAVEVDKDTKPQEHIKPPKRGSTEGWIPAGRIQIRPTDDGSGQWEVLSQGKHKRVCAASLFAFSINNPIRREFLWLIEWPWFDRFILLLIIFNSVLLSVYQYRDSEATVNKVMEAVDPVLLVFFVLEMCIKIVSIGFFKDAHSYLRDGWNWLDFVVVVSGIISLANGMSSDGEEDSGNLGWLRVFRVMRPLRSLTVMPQMRILVNTVLKSIPRLVDVMGMAVFLFIVFGIMGVMFWNGVMSRTCRITEHPVWDKDIYGDDPSLSCWRWTPIGERLCGGWYMCDGEGEPAWCGSNFVDDIDPKLRPTFNGTDDMQGAPWCWDDRSERPFLGDPTRIGAFNWRFTHFDHLPAAMLVIFQCTTLEGWTDIMYMLEDAFSAWFAPLYFCIMIFMTNFFLLNVALAVIWEAFSEFSSQAHEDEEKAKAENGEEAEEEAKEEEEEAVGLVDDGEPAYIDCACVHFLRKIAYSERFVTVIMFFITANVVTMMMDQFPPPDVKEAEALDILNHIFTWVFVGEMIVVHGALGPRKYWTNPITAFDGIIVATSVVEYFGTGGGGGAIRAFRGFRLLRIFRLAKKWTSFRVLLKSIAETVMSMGNFTVLLVIMMYVFTLMAMNFFALQFKFEDGEGVWLGMKKWDGHDPDEKITDPYCGKMYGNSDILPDGEKDLSCVPRAHFDTFIWSFVTIFQILSGENWNTTMYDGMKSGGYGWCLFFVAVVIVGQMIILNLFLAILMAKFEDASSTISALEKQKKQVIGAMAASSLAKGLTPGPSSSGGTSSTTGPKEGQGDAKLKAAADASDDNGAKPPDCDPADPNLNLPGQLPEDPKDNDGVKSNQQATAATPESPAGQKAIEVEHDAPPAGSEELTNNFPHDYAFMCLSRTNPIRVNATWLAHNHVFDNFILVCILISSCFMALDHPMNDPRGPLPTFLRAANTFFSVAFFIEMIVKWISMGLIWGKHCYLRNAWNILDFIVVCVSLIDLLNLGSGLKSLKTLRMIRALRPLRVISRNENLKLVVNTLFKSIPELVNLLIVGILFFLIFALFGVGYFKGSFFLCTEAYSRNIPFSFPLDEYAGLTASTGRSNTVLPEILEIAERHAGMPSFIKDSHADMMIPLCMSTSKLLDVDNGPNAGAGYALGSFDEDAGKFTMESDCKEGHVYYRRRTHDTPICVGRCLPYHDVEPGDNPGFCRQPPTKVEELPPVGNCASRELTLDEQKGQQFYEAMGFSQVLSCAGGVYNGETFLGCREKYCGNSVPKSQIDECEDWCKRDNYFCEETCKDSLLNGAPESEDCSECRRQCRAACECPLHCEARIDDAATCVEQGGKWVQALSQNFDNILTAMLTLFEISTTEGWVDVMYQATDARGPYKEPVRDSQEIWALFFVVFILVGSFFILNLCVGVILDNFNKIKDDGHEVFMTPEQREWLNAKKAFFHKKFFFGMHDLHLQSTNRVKAYFMQSNPKFENFIMLCIILNTVTMAMKVFPKPSEDYDIIIGYINYVFAAIFTIECFIKLYALREVYFKDDWNKFDICCVFATLVGIIINEATDLEIGSVMSAIRLFRIARLFRLVRFAKGLNRLFTAFVLSIPKLLNVAGIMCLLLFLFAVLGVQTFGRVKFTGNLGPHGNFRDWGRGMMLLVRSMTGEGFNELMHSFSKDEVWFMQVEEDPCYSSDLHDVTADTYDLLKDKCLIDEPNQCGKSNFAYIYFVVYTCLITFIIFNLVVAVILEGFEDASTNEESDLVGHCIETWKKYDVNYRMVLPLPEIFMFLKEVIDISQAAKEEKHERGLLAPFYPPSLGKDGKCDIKAIPMWIANSSHLHYEVETQSMHFVDAVQMAFAVVLSQNSPMHCKLMKEKAEEDVKESKKIKHFEEKHKKTKDFQRKMTGGGKETDLATEVASTKIQVLFQGRQARKKVLAEKRALEQQRDIAVKAQTPPAAG